MTVALRVEGVSKAFGSVQALAQVGFTLDKGQMLAVLGASGCGKTTLLRCIAGFETPDEGSITVAGEPMFGPRHNVRAERRRIGYVPQEGVLFPHLSVARNIGFGLKSPQLRRRRVAEMLDLTGLTGLGERMPHELSGGQRQRVALARALAPAPELILLDEPFSALDAGLRESLRHEVRDVLKSIGATAIIVTHDQEEALSIADRVCVMREGRCLQTADPVTLYHRPSDLEVARFVGDANLVPASVKDGLAQSDLGAWPVAAGCPRDCPEAIVMIRPEQCVLCRDKAGVAARVVHAAYFGRDSLLQVRLDDDAGETLLQVRVPGAVSLAPGDLIRLKVDGEVVVYPVPDRCPLTEV